MNFVSVVYIRNFSVSPEFADFQSLADTSAERLAINLHTSTARY